VTTEEAREILGFACKKYTYKKIFGEVWLTDQVTLPNDEKYTLDLKDVRMTVAINKVNYFTF
jgi:hypothetical protein